MQIIALCGKKGSGKDTIADELCKMLSTNSLEYTRIAFASALKQMLSQLFNIDSSYFHDVTLKEKVIPGISYTPRQLMQIFSTNVLDEGLRKHLPGILKEDESVWSNQIRTYLNNIKDANRVVIITDCRLDCEMKMLREFDTKFILLERDAHTCAYSISKESEHISEKTFDKSMYDHVFSNNTSEDIKRVATEIANTL